MFFSSIFYAFLQKTYYASVLMAQNRVHKGDFSMLSNGEFPIFTGPVEFVNRFGSGP
jgi:hypothetical protein